MKGGKEESERERENRINKVWRRNESTKGIESSGRALGLTR